MNKKVTVTFEDYDSLTVDEIAANLKNVYGKNASIKVGPASSSPLSHLYFGISELLTGKQSEVFFDQPELYEQKLRTIRDETIKQILFVVNDVIMDNEEKFSS
jgi:hypothetical protein